MRFLILMFLLSTLIIHCNHGPAEDRGKMGCDNAKSVFLLSYLLANDKNIPDDDTNKKIASRTLILNLYSVGSDCDPTKRDSKLNRYYRGYIEGKE